MYEVLNMFSILINKYWHIIFTTRFVLQPSNVTNVLAILKVYVQQLFIIYIYIYIIVILLTFFYYIMLIINLTTLIQPDYPSPHQTNQLNHPKPNKSTQPP